MMNTMNKASALAVTFSLLFARSSYATPALSMKVSGEPTVDDVNNFAVTVNVTNTGDESLKLYKDPRGALSSFPENTFSISSIDADGDGHPDFVGARVKYGFDAATEFVTLEPGSSFIVSHDLSKAYNFSKVGDYNIEAETLFFYQDASGSPVPISASVSTPHQAKLSGNLVSRALTKRSLEYAAELDEVERLARRDAESSGVLERRATYRSCSTSRRNQISSALSPAVSYISDAVSALRATTSSGYTRYETWFGTYSSTRKARVLSHFTSIRSHNVRTYRYVCGCTDDAFAYVYPNEPKIVYLCSSFWPAPTTGQDSKAGTIIHEASHFTVNGGTRDLAYGHSRAQALAVSSPADAVMNADSHEYYAENTY